MSVWNLQPYSLPIIRVIVRLMRGKEEEGAQGNMQKDTWCTLSFRLATKTQFRKERVNNSNQLDKKLSRVLPLSPSLSRCLSFFFFQYTFFFCMCLSSPKNLVPLKLQKEQGHCCIGTPHFPGTHHTQEQADMHKEKKMCMHSKPPYVRKRMHTQPLPPYTTKRLQVKIHTLFGDHWSLEDASNK